jgi:hypothetical protein
MNIEFTESMNEISGFGGYYERCCRRAVVVGAEWCATHRGIFDPETIQQVICDALVAQDDGCKVRLGDELTGTQMAVAMYHIRFISGHGWNEYREKMSAPMVVYSDPQMGSARERAG